MVIKLLYRTDTGLDWLEEIVEVNEFNYMTAIDNYIEKNQQKADALEDRWQANGEDVVLIFDIEPVDTSYSDELFKRVYTYGAYL